MSQTYGGVFKRAKHCFICGKVNHLTKNCFLNPINQGNPFYHIYGYGNRSVHGSSHQNSFFKSKKTSKNVSAAKVPLKPKTAPDSTILPNKLKKVYPVKKVNTVSSFNTANSVNAGKKVNAVSSFNTANGVNAVKQVNTVGVKSKSKDNLSMHSTSVLKEFTYVDAKGQPKTTLAWVPKSN